MVDLDVVYYYSEHNCLFAQKDVIEAEVPYQMWRCSTKKILVLVRGVLSYGLSMDKSASGHPLHYLFLCSSADVGHIAARDAVIC